MQRIAVIATIRDAYTFLAVNLGTIIGLVWVPMVLITIAQYFTLYRLYNGSIEFLAGGNAAHLGAALLMTLACLVAALLLYAMMLVAVMQLALGTRSGPSLVHFAFGPLEWRMFRALFAFTGLTMLTGLTILFAANAVFALVTGAKSDQAALGDVMGLVMLCMGLVFAARFLLLLPAIAVNEAGPALRRAWALSAGNFLPLLGILLAVLLPVKLIQILIEVWLSGKTVLAAGATPQVQLMDAILNARQMLPMACGLSFLVSPILVGLFASASASVWRALKDEPALDIAV